MPQPVAWALTMLANILHDRSGWTGQPTGFMLVSSCASFGLCSCYEHRVCGTDQKLYSLYSRAAADKHRCISCPVHPVAQSAERAARAAPASGVEGMGHRFVRRWCIDNIHHA
jgi:hypothetical protein